MADILTERTQFTCAAAPAVVFTISMSGKVTHKGSKVLTTKAELSGNGNCQRLTAAAQGVLQPCQFNQKLSPWNNSSSKCRAEGNALLTENSFCICPVPICAGSKVEVQAANALNLKGSD